MKSLDRQSLEEQARLVSRYVAGDLSRSERAEFEAWLVASHELAAEVEMERRLRRGIASAARRGWLKRGAEAVSEVRERRWRMAIAASVVVSLLLMGVTFVLPSGSRNESQTVASSSQVIPALPRIVRLSANRSLETTPDIALSRQAPPSELTIEPAVVVLTCPDGSLELECAGGTLPQTPQYPEYEMDLVSRQGSNLAWRSARQIASTGPVLSFVLGEPEKLAAGDYDVIVRGHSPDHEEVVARFWLRVN